MRAASLLSTARPGAAPRPPACRCCGAVLAETVLDAGQQPVAEPLVPPQRAAAMEPHWPLRAMACLDCALVQLPGPARFRAAPALPERPPQGWLAQGWPGQAAALAARLGLDAETLVLQADAGDGARLLPFLRRGIGVLALEPRARLAARARARGIRTEERAFGAATARELRAAGVEPVVILAGEALAEAEDPHDLAAGWRTLLAPGGLLLLDVPHLLPVIRAGRVGAIRHGRVALWSLSAVEILLAQHGLVVAAAEEAAEAGLLRITARHTEDHAAAPDPGIAEVRRREMIAGLDRAHAYRSFAEDAAEAKCALLDFLVGARRAGQRVVGLGAGPEAVALANFCALRPDLLPFVVDPLPRRHGMLLPGSRIPVRPPEAVAETRPDFLLILSRIPREEVARAHGVLRDWGGRFASPLPTLSIF